MYVYIGAAGHATDIYVYMGAASHATVAHTCVVQHAVGRSHMCSTCYRWLPRVLILLHSATYTLPVAMRLCTYAHSSSSFILSGPPSPNA